MTNEIDLDTITIEAGPASDTSTGTERGIDVDFELTFGGKTISGEVTLLPAQDGSGYSSWGDPDHWVEGAALSELRAFFADQLGDVLSMIASACGPIADDFRVENEIAQNREIMAEEGEDAYDEEGDL